MNEESCKQNWTHEEQSEEGTQDYPEEVSSDELSSQGTEESNTFEEDVTFWYASEDE